jgi:hypothetical protein
MGWHEFIGWLQTMRRQVEPEDPRHRTREDTLAQTAEDDWWQQAREERARERG